jgi:hypothetical protein
VAAGDPIAAAGPIAVAERPVGIVAVGIVAGGTAGPGADSLAAAGQDSLGLDRPGPGPAAAVVASL